MTPIDCHIHTSFSFDSEASPKIILQTAARFGAAFLAITDHVDLNSEDQNAKKVFDPYKQFQSISNLRHSYKDLTVSIGAEVGFTPQNYLQNKALVDSSPFECVINSVHEVDGHDCYFADYFEGKDKYYAYSRYLQNVRRSLDAPYYFCTLGHLGYVTRNAPYPDRELNYNDYKEILDDILSTVIEKNIILEINSSAYSLKDKILPNVQILRRYYDLGGRLINFGSDAHRPERLFDRLEHAATIAKQIGFTHFTAVKDRQFIKFPL